MKVSLNWLSEFIDLTLDPDSLSHLLTMAGVEVENVTSVGVHIPLVVVAQILSSDPHPNADRLSVCSVEDGSGTPRQIVCGAKNYKIGDKVPLALPGAVLPGDFKIKKGKLRGVDSDGMLCSASELNIAADSDGLLILAPDAPIGTAMHELFPSDTIFDLEITPNRGDLLSHFGLARELSALTGKSLIEPESGRDSDADNSGQMRVEIHEPDLCAFYSARFLHGVQVSPSPAWLVRRLESVGLRAINNIVDVTNFVLLETGQPLHAFDADRVSGKIVVRRALEGETFSALDGKTYRLSPDNLVIADDQKVLALAGVMGGADSGVTETTTRVILESAEFLASSVRRTSRNLGLLSDSSHRFERGVDRHGVLPASRRAVDLILDLAGGEAERGISTAGNRTIPLTRVQLRPDRCRKLLGAPVSDEEIARMLMLFGLARTREDEGVSEWEIPSCRRDLCREVDLIEEVARVYGLDRIPVGHIVSTSAESADDRAHDFRMRLRRTLQGAGFQEARTLTLLSESSLADHVTGIHEPLRVRNPLGEDSAALRPGLMPGLIHSAAFNARQGAENIRLFEIGRVFRKDVPEESTQLGIVLSGKVRPASWRESSPTEADFFDLKGVLTELTPVALEFRWIELPGLAVAAEIVAAGERIGVAGQVWPKRVRTLDIRGALLVAEIDLEQLQNLGVQSAKFAPWPRFPATRRDVAMLVSADVTHYQVGQVLMGGKEPLLKDVELFDIFNDPTGEKVPAGFKSMAFALTYQSEERTLNSDEVNEAHNRLKERLQTRLGVQLRE